MLFICWNWVIFIFRMPNGNNVDMLALFKQAYPSYFKIKVVKKKEFLDLI